MKKFSLTPYAPLLVTATIVLLPLSAVAQQFVQQGTNMNSYVTPGGGPQQPYVVNQIQGVNTIPSFVDTEINPVYAQPSRPFSTDGPNAGAGSPPNSSAPPQPASQQNVNNVNSGNQGSAQLVNPLKVSNFCDLIKIILQAILIIGLPIAVIFLVIVGFKFILAQGNGKQIEAAKRDFLNTIIGIAIFLGAWAIAKIIAATLAGLGASAVNECVK